MHRNYFTEWTLTIKKKNAATSIFVVYDIMCKIIDALQGQFWENQLCVLFYFSFHKNIFHLLLYCNTSIFPLSSPSSLLSFSLSYPLSNSC
jgi:hypothetical protein